MPRLFIHLDNQLGESRDETGADYDTEDAAVRRAGRSAGEILSDDLAAGRTPVDLTLTIERADGSAVATIAVSARIDRPA